MRTQQASAWTASDAAGLYHLPGWSEGYFRVDETGRVVADVDRDGQRCVVLDDVIRRATAGGLQTPLVIRFQDIIASRVRQLNEAFDAARTEFEYTPAYRGVYPIKVNRR
ncbi:MAG: arginine decarboxylase, partial [Rhodothermales bacterium]|nr:arginine decarboxylase [Rhodothermales bacterium]